MTQLDTTDHFVGTLYSATLSSHFDALRVRFQILGRSPNLCRIKLAASVLADTAHVRWYLLGELSMWIRKLTLQGQSHQANCDQCCARTLEYCPRSCRRTPLVKIFVEIILRMTCNSRNSRKFRPTKFKRYTVYTRPSSAFPYCK